MLNHLPMQADRDDAKPPWLSVLVPVFNVASYLRQCVDSVMQQAAEGIELLLLDDCSTDGSAALMQQLAALYGPAVRVLAHASNQGLSAARNTMIDAARGQYLWFLDGDDWIAPGVVVRLKALVDRPDAHDIVFFDYRVERGSDSLKHRLRGEHQRPGFAGAPGRRIEGASALIEGVLATGNLFSWAHVSRRRLWADGLRFPAGRSFEDMATTPRLLLRATGGWHVREPWVMYRRRDDSISAQMSARKVADLSAALLGVRSELMHRLPTATPSLRFALAHQAARNLLATQRHAARLPPGQARVLWPHLRADFIAAVGDDLSLLQRGYWRRGWWWRAWRLRKALRRPAP